MVIIMGLENYHKTPIDIRKNAVLVCDYDVTSEASVIILRAIDKGFNTEELMDLIENITSKKRFLMARSTGAYFGNCSKAYYDSLDEFIDVQVDAGRSEETARLIWSLASMY